MTEAAPSLPNFDPLNEEHVRDSFMERIADLRQRFENLKLSHERCPAAVESEGDLRRFTDHVKNLKACAKALEEARKAEKGKYDACGKVVHGVATGYTEQLVKWARDAEARMTAYQRKEAEEERKRREEEERLAREEAERLAKEAADKAAALQSEEDLDKALAAEEEAKRAEEAAEKARREAEAKASGMHKARGEYGGVSSLQTRMTFEIKNAYDIPPSVLWPFIDAEAMQKALRKFMAVNKETVKRAVDAGEGEKIIKGVRFFEDVKSVVRG
jgi:DNA repair exonuclease SbcCD ATPase subunit